MRTTEPPAAIGVRVEAAVMAVVVALALVGAALLPLTTAPAVRGLVAVLHSERDTGLPMAETLDAAERVLDFVTDADAPALPQRFAGREGFDAFASAHLVDVRDVLVPARWATIVLVALAGAWVALRRRTERGRQAARAAASGAGALVLGGGALAVLVGAFDFDRLFTRFHGVFFEAGSWQFPSDALLIQVFPLRFWIAAGATWAGFAVVLAVGTLVAGRRFGSTTGR